MQLPLKKDTLLVVAVLAITLSAYVIATIAITVQTASNVDNVKKKPTTPKPPSTPKPNLTCVKSWLGPHFPDNGLHSIEPSTSAADQAAAVMGMIQRFLPNRYQEFSVTIMPTCLGPADRDTFILHTDAYNHLEIRASSGVAAAWGFQHYLKKYCGCQFAWAGNQLNVPSPLPTLNQDVTVISNDRFRYYQNTCTVSYTMAWWDWARWEKELDWMALNGINLPLGFTGQEAIYQKVFLKMGITQAELDKFFGGPAFLAWARMGNLRGWGGPLPQSWIDTQLDLQKKILERARQFGMTPVLPAFAGFVPEGMKRIYPNATIGRTSIWGRFNSTYCCPFLVDPQDPLFVEIGKKFINELTAEYGTDHIYNADTFNENKPASNNTDYVKAAGNAVFQGMVQADPQAIWVMQGWMFVHDKFWQPPQVEALLTSVPLGRMIILDLQAEMQPQYQRFKSYYGQPFIWNMLHNFGGTMALYGILDNVNTGPFAARSFVNSTMLGTGLTPEGIHQNEVMYEFMNEHIWRTEPRDLPSWLTDYARRRYGKITTDIDAAWQLLKRSVFNCTDGHENHSKQVIVTSRPQVKQLQPKVWYDPRDVFNAWKHFLSASSELRDSALYRYDLADISQQALNLIAIHYYDDIIGNFTDKKKEPMLDAFEKLLGLIDDLDNVLGSDSHFLLGNWLEDAKKMGTNEGEKALLEYNARNQLTLWGPEANVLDYACKQWSGLISGYYKPRWVFFANVLNNSLSGGRGFNQAVFHNACMTDIETPFTKAKLLYPTTPSGDTIALSQAAYDKHKSVMESKFFENMAKDIAAKKKFSKSKIVRNKKVRALIEKKYAKQLTESGQAYKLDLDGW